MRNKRFLRVITAFLAVLILTTGFSATAFAGGGEESETVTPEPTPTPAPDPQPLTPPGNMELVDDYSGEQSESKQFITVVTKSGDYFYLVIDRAGDRENVHFLNLVDEADLMAIIEGDKK